MKPKPFKNSQEFARYMERVTGKPFKAAASADGATAYKYLTGQRDDTNLFTDSDLVAILVLLCHKRREQQNGQHASCLSKNLASWMRSVVIEDGLCRSARTRRAAREEVGRNFRGA